MTTTATRTDPRLDAPYDLTPEHVRRFREDGFIKLKDVWDAGVIDEYGEEITRLALAEASDVPMDQRDTYSRAFIQVINMWQRSETARAFSFNRRTARLAAELMGVEGVRLYHDQALYKEPAGGFTPWHVDQQYWPLEGGNTVTVWMPLQATPIEMGPLQFGRGSHLKNIGRDLEIGDESERRIRDAVKSQGVIEFMEPYDLGEVSFHYGWTLHRAGGNTTDLPRKVHTVIYMDKDIRLIEPKNKHHHGAYEQRFAGMKPGDVAANELHPVLWEM